MKRYSRQKTNIQVITILVIPLLLIILSSLGYAAWTDQISTIANLASADYQIEILDCWTQEYNGQGCELLWQLGGKTIAFTDEALFPGWQLTLYAKIHNKGITESWVATLNYTLSYLDPQTQNWIECTPTELYDLFKIAYTGTFYLEPGPDGLWNTPDDVPMPQGYQIIPCHSVYNRQTLYFDAQNHPELANTTFTIKITIIATYPVDTEETT